MFQTKVVEKVETQHFMLNCFTYENRAVYVVKYCRAERATEGNMADAHCMPNN